MCCDKTVEYSLCDGWPNGDVGGRKLQRLVRSSRRGALELLKTLMYGHRKLVYRWRCLKIDEDRWTVQFVRHGSHPQRCRGVACQRRDFDLSLAMRSARLLVAALADWTGSVESIVLPTDDYRDSKHGIVQGTLQLLSEQREKRAVWLIIIFFLKFTLYWNNYATANTNVDSST